MECFHCVLLLLRLTSVFVFQIFQLGGAWTTQTYHQMDMTASFCLLTDRWVDNKPPGWLRPCPLRSLSCRLQQPGQRCGSSNPPYLNSILYYRGQSTFSLSLSAKTTSPTNPVSHPSPSPCHTHPLSPHQSPWLLDLISLCFVTISPITSIYLKMPVPGKILQACWEM